MPFELRVQVRGTPGGAPEFADDQTVQGTQAPTTESPSASTSQSAGPQNEASDDVDTGLSTPVKAGMAGALGLVAIVCAGLALLLLRRSTR